MKVFKYWVKQEQSTRHDEGYHYMLACWGGSNESVEDASQIAHSKLENLIGKFKCNDVLDEYEYGTEIRELLVDEIHNSQGELIAAITRNRYGALVLNSRNTFIADIDNELPGCLSIFSSRQKLQDNLLQKIEDFSRAHRDLGIRLYKTHSGLRLFITNENIPTSDQRAKQFLKELNSDYLYQTLCFKQECYRARLTPKPWRIGLTRPSKTLPDMNDEEWATYTQWLNDYEESSHGRGVCHLVNTWGPSSMNEETKRIINMHDEHALCEERIELA